MKKLFAWMLLVLFASAPVMAQSDSTAVMKRLEGVYSTDLPANPGNYSKAKVVFDAGKARLFVDGCEVPILACTIEKDSVSLKLELEGESVLVQLSPAENAVKGLALYDGIKIPFMAKKEVKE